MQLRLSVVCASADIRNELLNQPPNVVRRAWNIPKTVKRVAPGARGRNFLEDD
jgi:hypothetical protein